MVLDHQVTETASTVPTTVVAASKATVFAASHRRRVTDWVQTSWWVPSSISRATNGAAQNIPMSKGTTTVRLTRSMMAPSPSKRPWPTASQLAVAAHDLKAEW